jgi:hypothetical protein
MATMISYCGITPSSPGIVVPTGRLRGAPIGAAFSGRSVPISFTWRVLRT